MLAIDVRYPEMCRGVTVKLARADIDWDSVAIGPIAMTADVVGYDGAVELHHLTDGSHTWLTVGDTVLPCKVTFTRPAWGQFMRELAPFASVVDSHRPAVRDVLRELLNVADSGSAADVVERLNALASVYGVNPS